MTATSADSIDTLPVNYNVDQLKAWIIRKLGSPSWTVELSAQQCLDAIKDSVDLYSQYRPKIRYRPIHLITDQHEYFRGEDLGFGVTDVQFLDPVPVPTELFYGNLIDPAPILRVGMDEYDTFLRWRKTWARVTSVRPDWFYDDVDRVLYIHNPITRYQASCFYLTPFTVETISALDLTGKQWVRDYALAKANQTLGTVYSKYQGAIPGPVSQVVLDQSKTDKSQTEIERLEARLHGMQTLTAIQTD